MKTLPSLLILAFGLTLGLASTALAATRVTLDTSRLIGLSSGPFYLDFQLNDGTGEPDSEARINHLDFGGGSALGSATTFGGASGDLLTGVTLTDTEAFNEFYQAFDPGAQLSFNLTLTGAFTGGVPDIFGFAVLDANLFNLATYSFGSDQLVIATLGEQGPTFATFASLDGTLPAPRVADTGNVLLLTAAALASLVLAREVSPRRARK